MGQTESQHQEQTSSGKWSVVKETSKPTVTSKKLDKLLKKNPIYVDVAKTLTKFVTDLAGVDPPQAVTNQIVLDVINKSKQIKYKDRTVIIEEGEVADGVYFVVSGEVEVRGLDTVYESDEEQPLLLDVLTDGDMFGDLGVFWNQSQPNVSWVTTGTQTILLRLPAATVHQLYPITSAQLPTLDKWCIIRQELICMAGLDKVVVTRQICMDILTKVVLFSSWSTDSLSRLVISLGSCPLTFYPPGAYLTCTGDIDSHLIILATGSVDVFPGLSSTKLLTRFIARPLPFTIGEEGVFIKDWEHKLTLVAATPCYVIRVNLDQLESCLEQCTFNEKDDWTCKSQEWMSLVSRRNSNLYQQYEPLLQIEVLYDTYIALEEFGSHNPEEVYNSARKSLPVRYEKDQTLTKVENTEDMYYVIEGSIKLVNRATTKPVTLITYKPGMVVQQQDWMPRQAEFIAVEQTLVMCVGTMAEPDLQQLDDV